MLMLYNDRQEPRHQAIKRTWTKVINTESFNQPSMPDTKKHKKTVNVAKEKIPPAGTPEINLVVAHKETKQPEETETDEEKLNSSVKPVKPTEELELNTSDKENVSIDQQQEEVKQQVRGLFTHLYVLLIVHLLEN